MKNCSIFHVSRFVGAVCDVRACECATIINVNNTKKRHPSHPFLVFSPKFICNGEYEGKACVCVCARVCSRFLNTLKHTFSIIKKCKDEDQILNEGAHIMQRQTNTRTHTLTKIVTFCNGYIANELLGDRTIKVWRNQCHYHRWYLYWNQLI